MEGKEANVEGEEEEVKVEVEVWKTGDDDIHMTDEGETSGSGLGSWM